MNSLTSVCFMYRLPKIIPLFPPLFFFFCQDPNEVSTHFLTHKLETGQTVDTVRSQLLIALSFLREEAFLAYQEKEKLSYFLESQEGVILQPPLVIRSNA